MIERFEHFFAAVNDGRAPYPWQRDLVERVARDGRWPAAISAPTGAGKSSVVDVHVFLVAHRGEVRVPRRMVLVAPRRALVEDQFERAKTLAAQLLRSDAEPIVREVTGALKSLCSYLDEDEPPLGVADLRGGVRLDLSWRLDPTRCQIICATPQMWGSRLLMRGFRGSLRSRNLETGLLGHDAVAIVDEAHLNERLVDTATRVAANGAGPLALQVVAMSATRTAENAVRLTERDFEDERLALRVRATKRITTVAVADWRKDAVARLAAEATRLHDAGTVGVFVNTVAMALDVADRLEGTVKVVCGRMRPADVEELRDAYEGLLDARGRRDVDFLVSTQSLEVGVDLDLPAMVTAIAPASALAQRAGRLNRSGLQGDAQLVVVVPGDPHGVRFDPYSEQQILDAMTWLEALDGDASPERISATPLPLEASASRPPLSRVDLETFAMAGIELAADADVGFFIDEPVMRELPSVSIGARAFLDWPEPTVRHMLLAAPPRARELASISIDHVKRLLAVCPGAWLIRDREPSRLDDANKLKPGDVVLVADQSPIVTRGVIGLVGRSNGDPIRDVREDPTEPTERDVIKPLGREQMQPILEQDPTLGSLAARRALAPLADERLQAARVRDFDVTWCSDEEKDRGLLVVTASRLQGRLPRTPVEERIVTLEAHQNAVVERVGEILDRLVANGEALGASRDQLLDAARWHDAGKVHPMFQQRMGVVHECKPVAKSLPGHTADRGDGWRHESLSAAFAWVRSGGDPLVAVLIAAHHGHGLPLFDRDPDGMLAGWADCEPEVEAALRELFGPFGRYELERVRLIRTLGLHRVAHLEALLRCADMQVSREGR